MNEHVVVILCSDAGGDGSVAGVVRKHVEALCVTFPVVVLSRNELRNSSIKSIVVNTSTVSWLRRFGHVFSDFIFAREALKQLKKLSRKQRIGLVICHSHSLAALAALPLKRLLGIPYALVIHADIFDRPHGTYDRRLTRYYKWVTPVAYRNADLLFAISPKMAECATERGADTVNVISLPNGIDPKDIGIESVALNAANTDVTNDSAGFVNRLELLFVGRLSIEKGLHLLIESCSILKKKQIPFRLKVVGAGPMLNSLQKDIIKRNLHHEVMFEGAVNRAELGGFYQSADMTIVPSLSEPQGIVVLESLVSGTPVVGANTGGIPSMVEHGKNGLLFSTGDATALSENIEAIWLNPKLLIKMKRLSKESIWPTFSWKFIGEKLVATVEYFIANGSVVKSAGLVKSAG